MAQTFNTQLFNISFHFLNILKVNFTKNWLEENLLTQPYYPSLYSLNNTLSKLKIENIATEITKEQFNELEPPFVAYLSYLSAGKDFVLITKNTIDEVEFIYEGAKAIKEKKEFFFKRWMNIVLLAEPSGISGQLNYSESLKNEQKNKRDQNLLIVATFLIAFIAVFSFLTNVDLFVPATVLLITKLSGTFITVLLLWYQVDKTNPFVKNICVGGAKKNCDAVLNSRASSFMGVTWSEAGFFYFAGSILFLLMPGLSFIIKLPWLSIAALLVSPYIIFSIYYQAKIIKQWCPLCLATQAVLSIELITCIIFYWSDPVLTVFNNGLFTSVLIAILLPMSVWYFLKPFFLGSKNSVTYQQAYKRILYNPDYFNTLLQAQPLAPEGWQNLGINLGNQSAQNQIIKVCNPYCGPCGKAHPVLDDLIMNKNINVKIIFTAENNEEDKDSAIAKHLLALAEKMDMQKTIKAMDDWYLSIPKDYEKFAAKYPLNSELKLQGDKLEVMSAWCEKAEIFETPTFFINGKKMPVDYSINDLKFILKDHTF